MGEAEDSTNHMITYTSLREIKVLIKHWEILDDLTIKEEEEEHLEEIEYTMFDKVLKICAKVGQDMVEKIKKILARDGHSYDIEWSHLCFLKCLVSYFGSWFMQYFNYPFVILKISFNKKSDIF